MNEILAILLQSALFATPILLAALGEVITERAGVVNLGVEGMMSVGALAGFVTAFYSGNLLLGCAIAMVVGALAAMLHAFVSITLRANQFVSGLALAMLGMGLAGLLGKQFEGKTLEHSISQISFTIVAVMLALITWFLFYRTRLGLIIRSTGEYPATVDALGIDVFKVRYAATMIGGALAGLAGAYLSLSQRTSWSDGMTSGLGWVAVALTIFVMWNPIITVFGAFFFSLLRYLAFKLQGNSSIPSEVLLAAPYILVVVVLVLANLRRSQGNAPEALGLPYIRGQR